MAAPPYKKNYTLKPLEGQEAFSNEGGLFAVSDCFQPLIHASSGVCFILSLWKIQKQKRIT